LRLQQHLGDDESAWPKHCIVEVPPEIKADIDRVVEAVQVAHINPQKAKSIIGVVNSEEMKRWFIDVALWSGFWRAQRRISAQVTKTKKSIRIPIRQKQLEELFNRDGWHCRYCGNPVGGNRKHFKKFAKQIDMPELIHGRSDETRHGIYLMMMASYDHVESHSRGGTDDFSNLVTACWQCQFGKYKFELLELGVDDPRSRKPNTKRGWAGLT
jgi:5-methylcytosine-specific restriction endonuclease McrA